MKRLVFYTLISLFSLSFNHTYGQINDTRGTDFWVSYMWNGDISQGDNTCGVYATGPRNCTVTLTNPSTGWSTTLSVTPNTINQVAVPMAQGFHSTAGVVVHKGIHVTSTDTIWLFSITKGNPNLDIANILPIEMIGSEYMVQAFPSADTPTEFVIVAAEDSVIVDIKPSCNTSNGYSAGNTYSITLPTAGSSIQIQGATNQDITGTTIKARNAKKIAVFNGNACLYVPNQEIGQSCDHVVEQAVPVCQWGRRFVARGSERGLNKRDRVRITSLENNCQVRINNSLVSTLNSGQSYTHVMSSNTEVDYIATTGPAVAYEYFPSMNSAEYDGDPSMITLPPLEQGVKEAKFASPSTVLTTGGLNSHAIIVITPTNNTSNMRLDGAYIGSSFGTVGSSSGFSYLYRTVTAGPHTLKSTSDSTFIAYSFGFGPRVSYGYGVGISSKNLNRPTVLINNEPNNDEVSICQYDTVHFSVDSGNVHLNQVTWHVQESNTDYSGYPVRIPFPTPGTYHVYGYIRFTYQNPSTDYRYDTVLTTVTVFRAGYTDIYDTICTNAQPYHFHDHTLTGDTTLSVSGEEQCPWTETLHLKVIDMQYFALDTVVCDQDYPYEWNGILFEPEMDSASTTITFTDRLGCDSIMHYQLNFGNTNSTYSDTIVCKTTPPYEWNGLTFYGDDTLSVTLTNSTQCDSIKYYSVRFIDTHWHYSDTTICSFHLPYEWHSHTFDESDTFVDYVTMADDCDSAYSYTLNTIHCDCDDSVAIWAPNIFTPTQATNNIFKISTLNIIEATMVIYQRFGMNITTLDALTQGWDGTKDGKPCNQGAYVYKITYKTSCNPNETQVKYGTVMLVR